jgi:hypothetical protein
LNRQDAKDAKKKIIRISVTVQSPMKTRAKAAACVWHATPLKRIARIKELLKEKPPTRRKRWLGNQGEGGAHGSQGPRSQEKTSAHTCGLLEGNLYTFILERGAPTVRRV